MLLDAYLRGPTAIPKFEVMDLECAEFIPQHTLKILQINLKIRK